MLFFAVLFGVVLGILLFAGISAFLGPHSRETKDPGQQLHALRDVSARKFVERIVKELKVQALNGRSDYEFHFRQTNLWFDWITVGPFTFPFFVSYWGCIDSEYSRKVIQKMLQSSERKLFVQWSVHSRYPQFGAPKWVLLVRWEE